MDQLDITSANTSKPDDLTTCYRRVRSKMIAKRIENSSTTSSWKTLLSKRKHFTWANSDGTANYDGPTILQILISSINSSTRVGVSDLKTSIRTTQLNQFQYNIVDMCDKIMTDYEMINEQGGRHDDIILDLFNSLLSGKYEIFNRFIERSKND